MEKFVKYIVLFVIFCKSVNCSPTFEDFFNDMAEKISVAWGKFIMVVKDPIREKRLGTTGRTKSRHVTPVYTPPIPNRKLSVATTFQNPFIYGSRNPTKITSGRTLAKLPYMHEMMSQYSNAAPKIAHMKSLNDEDEVTTLALKNKVEIPLIIEPTENNIWKTVTPMKVEYTDMFNTEIDSSAEDLSYTVKYMHHGTDNVDYEIELTTAKQEEKYTSRTKDVVILI